MDEKTTIISHKGLDFVSYISKETINLAVQRVANEISNDLRDKNPIFITILNGAFIFCSDLLRKLDFHLMDIEFCKASSYVETFTDFARYLNRIFEAISILCREKN